MCTCTHIAKELNLFQNTTQQTLHQSEEALIISAKNGDEYAFAALAELYRQVLELQVKLTNTPVSIKEDLLQEGLIGLFKAVKSYDGVSASFATYASRCIRNSIISGLRKYYTQAKTALPVADITNEETVPSAEEVHLDSVRARGLYDSVFSALSPYERVVFDMYLSEMSYADIAFVTGKSVKSATNAVYRIRTKLKQIVLQTKGITPNS